jgi:altronate hydrolase
MDILQIHPEDNVAVAVKPLAAGEAHKVGGAPLKLLEDIPAGHKAALKDIPKGQIIIKYGVPIGRATKDIRAGQWVHTQNLHTVLGGPSEYQYQHTPTNPLSLDTGLDTFEGYLRADGRVGVRNEIWILSTVNCAVPVSSQLAAMAGSRFAGASLDGIYAFAHDQGCSQIGDDLATTQDFLAGLAKNPNAGGVLLVGLGCEMNYLDLMKPKLEGMDPDRIRFLNLQDHEDELEAGLDLLAELAEAASLDMRQTLSVDNLVIGLECGGSDGFSGLSGNPLLGRISDHLVSLGGTAILTEVPEMFGAETSLMNRAVDEAVFKKIVDLINNYKKYFISYGQEVYENPSPGNKAGGISSLDEKSMGCLHKGGSAQVVDVLQYGQQPGVKGLNLMNGPGNDAISVTALCASGAQIVLFTTGRGTPLSAPCPTLKVATNSAMANRKKGWIDFNAGRILDGTPMDEAAAEFWKLILDVASGREKTKAEQRGYRQIAIMKDGIIT